MMKRSRSVTVVFATFLPLLFVVSVGNGCKKDDDDKPPVPVASAPPPAPTPSTPAQVTPEEDAGAPAPVDAGVDAGKPVGPGGGGGSGSIAKCCAALQQNANNAPLDQKVYYMQAAAACNGMRNAPAGQQAFANIRSFLAGAKMPPACK